MKFTIVFLYLTLLISNITISYGDNPPDSTGVRITKFNVSGKYDLGDTVIVISSYETDLPLTFEKRSLFNDILTPIGFTGTEYNTSTTVTLDTAVTYTDTTYYLVNDEGDVPLSCSIQFIPETDLYDIPDFSEYSSTFLAVKTGIEGGVIEETKSGTETKIDEFTEVNMNLGATGLHSFNYSGTVTYYDDWYSRTGYGPWTGAKQTGVPRATVRLWFKNKIGADKDKLFHPVPLDNGEYIEGVHYCITDMDGGFHFNIEDILGFTNDNWSVVLRVEKQNEYIVLNSPTCHNLVNMLDGSQKRIFWGLSGDISIPINYSLRVNTKDDVGLEIAKEDGQIFRYITIGGMFLKARFGLDIDAPFDDLPFEYGTGPDTIVNTYSGNTSHPREINNCYKPGLIIHEYGHIVHEYMRKAIESYAHCGTDIKEGWAEFYQFAALNWAEARFAEQTICVSRNLEAGPYFYGAAPGKPKHRFFLVYPGEGRPGYDAIKCREFACILWNLYDSYTDHEFLAERYQDKENDDISGFGSALFEFFMQHPKGLYYKDDYTGLDEQILFQDAFKDEVDPSKTNTHLRESIDKIWNCMAAGDVTSPPLIRPAQVANCGGEHDVFPGSYFFWIEPQKYGEEAHIVLDPDIVEWADAEADFRNLPDGYNVYRRQSRTCSWTFTAFLESPGFEYNGLEYWGILCELDPDCLGNIYTTQQIKISATNAQGDSYGDKIYWSGIWTSKDKSDIKDNTLEGDMTVSISPNPANSYFNINTYVPEPSKMEILIFDINQNIVKRISDGQQYIGDNNLNIKTNDLSSGIYFVRVVAFGQNTGIIYMDTKKLSLVK